MFVKALGASASPAAIRRGRARRGKSLRLVVIVAAALALVPAVAEAWVYSEIVDFNLTETTTTYGGYTISCCEDGGAYYRWLDDPDHTTVISGNNCGDVSLFGKDDIPAHDTTYHKLFQGSAGLCFLLRGRTAIGAGSMVNHDGRLRR